jgi:hypothetical protein
LIESKSDIINFISIATNDNENALEASYGVSYREGKAAKAHLIAERLIDPCVKDVVQYLLGENVAKMVDMVPLSNYTVSRQINDMSSNIETTVLKRLKIVHIIPSSWMN